MAAHLSKAGASTIRLTKHDTLRRFFSLALLLVFCTLSSAPLFAAPGALKDLPACCRRNGKHHCAMRFARTSPPSGSYFTAPAGTCPYFPRAILPGPGQTHLYAPTAQTRFISLQSQPLPSASAEEAAFHRFFSTLQERGPPPLPLA